MNKLFTGILLGGKVNTIKTFFLKIYFNLLLVTDSSLKWIERVQYYFKTIIAFGPIAFLLERLNLWFKDNSEFTTATILLVLINMIIGGIMHYKTKNFSWKTFLTKTLVMVVVINCTYIVLELILSRAGTNFVVEGFRAALQIATLLYPGGKILKNIFILSNGEHPPRWIMEKVYDFQESGDLAQFLSSTPEENK